MTTISKRDTGTSGAGREYWRGVLLTGGFTAIPRWTLDPVPGIAGYETVVPRDLVAALRRLAGELAMPLSSVLLAAHAKVLAALSGEDEVVTGYAPDGEPLPCRLTVGPGSWRKLLLGAHRTESQLLAHARFPVAGLRAELGLSGPSFETVFRPVGGGRGGDAELDGSTVLGVRLAEDGGGVVLRLRYRTDVLDADSGARIAGYHLAALTLIRSEEHTSELQSP